MEESLGKARCGKDKGQQTGIRHVAHLSQNVDAVCTLVKVSWVMQLESFSLKATEIYKVIASLNHFEYSPLRIHSRNIKQALGIHLGMI